MDSSSLKCFSSANSHLHFGHDRGWGGRWGGSVTMEINMEEAEPHIPPNTYR